MSKWFAIIASVWMLSGCAGGAATEAGEPVDAEIAGGYVTILQELTDIMDGASQTGDGAAGLSQVREYVNTNRARVSDEINALNRRILDMPEADRDAWRGQASPVIEAALEKFSDAQKKLRKHMNEAQQWELSEVLSQLK